MMILNNPHLQTIIPAFFRPSPKLAYDRHELITDDGDFLDIDYYEPHNKTKKLAILVHGLEGSSQDHYMLNMAQTLSRLDMNSAAINLRSCSGRLNNLLKTYHSGKTEDLVRVLNSIDKKYEEIYLIGFSIGGNIILKYLGEYKADSRIKKAYAISPPIDLESSAKALAQAGTKIYMMNLLKNLKKKITAKAKVFPGLISDDNFDEIKNFYDYDNKYTAPLNGFKNAEDYWQKASSKEFIKNIKTPTTILSSYDDPFLGPECFPEIKSDYLSTLYTQYGGHIGFMDFNWRKLSFEFFYEDMIYNLNYEINAHNL